MPAKKKLENRITMSIMQVMNLYPNQEAGILFFEQIRWPEGIYCPFCGNFDRISARRNHYYRCQNCKKDFTVRTGTAFGKSHIPLHKWIYAMYFLVTARKGISSMQLSKEIDITQKSAWFLLQRIRNGMSKGTLEKLAGIIQIDETFIGGKEKNKHKNKKKNLGRGSVGKTPVIGMRDSTGKVFAKPIKSVDMYTVTQTVFKNVAKGSEIHTDESNAYDTLHHSYEHKSINHSAKVYSLNGVTTNSIESVWALLKRGIYGVYHHVSEKHLEKYVSEFTFRLNEGNTKIKTADRIHMLALSLDNKRLTYKELVNERDDQGRKGTS